MKTIGTTLAIILLIATGYAQKLEHFQDANGKWGFKDNAGNVVVPPKYDKIGAVYNELTVVQTGLFADAKWGLVDQTGKEIVVPKYDYIYPFSDGLAHVHLNKKHGFIDKTGKVVIPLNYDFLYDFSEDKAAAKLKGKWGFIDKENKVAILFWYDRVRPFSEGLAAVNIGGIEHDDDRGFEGGQWGYIHDGRKEVIPRADYQDVGSFREGFAPFKKNGKWGYLSIKTGLPAIEAKYEATYDFENGKAKVLLNGKMITIDQNGKEIEK